MANVYFTNNFDSGDGSFRDALEKAEQGDVVAPDPNVDWGKNKVEIALASAIPIEKSVACDPGDLRVVLDGQGACRCLETKAVADAVFKRFDFINGYGQSGGCFYAGIDGSSSTFQYCLFAGGEATVNGGCVFAYDGAVNISDSVITGGKGGTRAGAGGLRANKLVDSLVLKRCTIVGNVGIDVATVLMADPRPECLDCVVGESTTDLNCYTPPSTVGFCAPPPDSIAEEEWTRELWKNYDLRLKPGSVALNGAQSVEEGALDLLGRPRTVNGAVGAYEGAWFVAKENEKKVLDENIIVDYAEIKDGAEIQMQGRDVCLAVRKSSEFGAATISAESRAYLAVPGDDDLSAANLNNVVRCEYGAGLTAFTATAETHAKALLTPVANDKTRRVLFEACENDAWKQVALDCNPVEVPLERSGRARFRAFDGANFYYDDAWTFTAVQFSVLCEWVSAENSNKNWEVIVQTSTTTESVAPGQSITILARIYDAFDSDSLLLNNGNNVESVSYSCYYENNGLFDETETPVDGHENVQADPSALLEAAQKSDAWDADERGYNFVLTPNVREKTLFEKEGEYRIKVVLTLKEGNPIVFYVPVSVANP